MFKCFFDDTTDPDNPRCIDCATQITLDDDEYECKKPGHDLNIEDTIKLPNFNECLNITGTVIYGNLPITVISQSLVMT